MTHGGRPDLDRSGTPGWAVHPVVDEGLGNTSWVLEVEGDALLVIDPSRDPRPHLSLAERAGGKLAYAVETHLHADFVSGTSELAARGATVIAPAAGGIEFPHRGVRDGDEIDMAGLTIRALATPGHTPEHLAYLLLDGPRPLALFSGGSLLVGAVARTDLIGPERTDALARQLWQSLQTRVLTLPDDVPVYPTHGGGSFCSATAGAARSTTIGDERAANPLLAAPDEDAFVARLVEGFGTFPPYFLHLRELNRRQPRLYGDSLAPLHLLHAEQVKQLKSEGAELVDVRPIDSVARGFIPGSLSIPLRPQFASWLGWLVPADRPLVFVADTNQDRDDLVRQCLKIGHERLAGELAGGVDGWANAGLPTETISLVAPHEVDAARVVDVRQDREFVAGHVPGSMHVELGALSEGGLDLPAGPLILMCGHGERAMSAATLLARSGRPDLQVVVGGPEDWARRATLLAEG